MGLLTGPPFFVGALIVAVLFLGLLIYIECSIARSEAEVRRIGARIKKLRQDIEELQESA